MSELRECPFCGSSAVLRFSAVTRIHCSNSFCGLESPNYANDDAEKLIRWWNTRPADAVRDGVVIPNAVVQFLLGAAPIDGKWFGDLHPKHPGRLWWRRLLRAALAQDGRKS